MKFEKSSANFLGIKNPLIQNTKAIILPYGLENTTSYGVGTKSGPKAILKASRQLELYDDFYNNEPQKNIGIMTAKLEKPPSKNHEAIPRIEKLISEILKLNKFPFMLGGEHTITAGAVNAFAKKYEEIIVIQFDAHTDLRQEYQNNIYSHACTMRRCLDNENIKLLSIGIRSSSIEEVDYLNKNKKRINIYWAKDKNHWELKEIIKFIKNKKTYITFDLDCFDPSLMPATGTPEPGGLFWDETLDILMRICSNSNVIGADINELSPIKNFQSCDFLAAKLCYKILSFVFNTHKKL